MKHLALSSFWKHYKKLPERIQKLADKNFNLLKKNSKHPSLHFKKVGQKDGKKLWSVRVGLHYRALGMEKQEGIIWFWIGSHSDYDKMLK